MNTGSVSAWLHQGDGLKLREESYAAFNVVPRPSFRPACRWAPGLLAYAVFMTAVFQALFAAFIRMRYQRTWEGQLTTQVELRHVVWGEVLWAALLATIYVSIVALVLTLFALVGVVDLSLAALPLTLPIAFLGGCGFAAFGLCFTALVPTIDHMNLPVFLVVIPMGMLSGTYFPITDRPALLDRLREDLDPRPPPMIVRAA